MVKRCLECGYDNSDLAETCAACGLPLVEVAVERPQPSPIAVDIPPGSGAIRAPVGVLRIRGPARPKVSFVLCLVATILVTVNALLAGLVGVAVPIPVWMIPLTFSNIQADFVGVLIGLGMFVSSFLILARREVYGCAAIIVLSLLSLLVGGGFIVGFLLGLVGAFIGLFRR